MSNGLMEKPWKMLLDRKRDALREVLDFLEKGVKFQTTYDVLTAERERLTTEINELKSMNCFM